MKIAQKEGLGQKVSQNPKEDKTVAKMVVVLVKETKLKLENQL